MVDSGKKKKRLTKQTNKQITPQIHSAVQNRAIEVPRVLSIKQILTIELLNLNFTDNKCVPTPLPMFLLASSRHFEHVATVITHHQLKNPSCNTIQLSQRQLRFQHPRFENQHSWLPSQICQPRFSIGYISSSRSLQRMRGIYQMTTNYTLCDLTGIFITCSIVTINSEQGTRPYTLVFAAEELIFVFNEANDRWPAMWKNSL